jgi:hypothetical protein
LIGIPKTPEVKKAKLQFRKKRQHLKPDAELKRLPRVAICTETSLNKRVCHLSKDLFSSKPNEVCQSPFLMAQKLEPAKTV